MSKWYYYLQHESPWNGWVEKNPVIQTQYDEIINRLTEQYKIHFGMPEVPTKCIIETKGDFTDLSGKTHHGFMIVATFGDETTIARGKDRYVHAIVVVMDGETPVEVVEIPREHILPSAKIIPFPRPKREPREFFLKDN